MEKESTENVQKVTETAQKVAAAVQKIAETVQKESKQLKETSQPMDDPAPPNRTPSPDSACSICLGRLENKSFTDSCFHTFCFTCLVEWSKVKAECPLCKQPFNSIIHSVRSFEDYDQYYLPPKQPVNAWDGADGRRFRYSTTLTAERRRQLAFERMLRYASRITRATFQLNQSNDLPAAHPSTSEFRRYIYERGLWVRPCGSSRVRDTSPEFYRQNPACTHRLIPWLNRELNVLLHNSESQVTFLLELVLALILRYRITSPEFREHVYPFIRHKTSHFIHEFFNFASAPHHMVVYDQRATYDRIEGNNSLSSAPLNPIVNSDTDSDIEVLEDLPVLTVASTVEISSTSSNFGSLDDGLPGPSSLPSDGLGPSLSPVTEDITVDDHNDSDNECIVLTELKPRRERTPELIDLISDDEIKPKKRKIVLKRPKFTDLKSSVASKKKRTKLKERKTSKSHKKTSESSSSSSSAYEAAGSSQESQPELFSSNFKASYSDSSDDETPMPKLRSIVIVRNDPKNDQPISDKPKKHKHKSLHKSYFIKT